MRYFAQRVTSRPLVVSCWALALFITVVNPTGVPFLVEFLANVILVFGGAALMIFAEAIYLHHKKRKTG